MSIYNYLNVFGDVYFFVYFNIFQFCKYRSTSRLIVSFCYRYIYKIVHTYFNSISITDNTNSCDRSALTN